MGRTRSNPGFGIGSVVAIGALIGVAYLIWKRSRPGAPVGTSVSMGPPAGVPAGTLYVDRRDGKVKRTAVTPYDLLPSMNSSSYDPSRDTTYIPN